jgi:hypothetical protein
LRWLILIRIMGMVWSGKKVYGLISSWVTMALREKPEASHSIWTMIMLLTTALLFLVLTKS